MGVATFSVPLQFGRTRIISYQKTASIVRETRGNLKPVVLEEPLDYISSFCVFVIFLSLLPYPSGNT